MPFAGVERGVGDESHDAGDQQRQAGEQAVPLSRRLALVTGAYAEDM